MVSWCATRLVQIHARFVRFTLPTVRDGAGGGGQRSGFYLYDRSRAGRRVDRLPVRVRAAAAGTAPCRRARARPSGVARFSGTGSDLRKIPNCNSSNLMTEFVYNKFVKIPEVTSNT